jgi:hypothetical protein
VFRSGRQALEAVREMRFIPAIASEMGVEIVEMVVNHRAASESRNAGCRARSASFSI